MKNLLLTALFLLSCFSANSQALYTQPIDPVGGYYHSCRWDPNDSDYDQYVWDAFRLTQEAYVTEIRWYGLFDPVYFGSGGPVRDFRISIHASIAVGTEPDVVNPPLYVFNTGGNANQTSAGTVGTNQIYSYAATLPRSFNARANVKYWVQIEAWQWGVPDWSLLKATGGDGAHFRGIAGSTLYYSMISGDTAFSLHGTTVTAQPAPYDFDGDGKTDISIFRPSNGQWWIDRSADGVIAHTFGNSADKLAPGDFTGDGVTDIAIFRPSTGSWYILRSEDFSFYSFPFGAASDIPVPGDYDGDSITDAAVFRPSNGNWYAQLSGGNMLIQRFGSATDLPVPADYDGDRKTDLAIYRPSSGQWWINRSTSGLIVHTFGTSTDKTTPGDFTGDGKADVAFFRPATGEWFVLRSENASYYSVPFGSTGDFPVPGDYDGDGKFDPGIYRQTSAEWYVQRSTAGLLIKNFGNETDLPVPNSGVRP